MTVDFDMIETAMKLMVKYKMKELVLPDGTKLTKEIHPLPIPRVRKPKRNYMDQLMNAPPLDDKLVPEDVLFAASNAPKLSNFSRYQINTVLPNKDD